MHPFLLYIMMGYTIMELIKVQTGATTGAMSPTMIVACMRTVRNVMIPYGTISRLEYT